jgi:hypothetical protein
LALKQAEEQQLRQWVSAFGTPQQVCLRSRIVVAASGQSDSAIAREMEVNRNSVILWRPPSNRSWTNYRAAVRPLKESSQDAPCHEGENRKRELLSYFADTTLATPRQIQFAWS